MQSPAALTGLATQFGVGLGLFYGIEKCFDAVGKELNDDTRLEIAKWILDAKTEPKFRKWVSAILNVFFATCGREHLIFPSTRPILSKRIHAAMIIGVACWVPCTLPVIADLYARDPAVLCPYTLWALIAVLVACLTVSFFSLGYCNLVMNRMATLQYLFLTIFAVVFIAGFVIPVVSFRIMMYGHFISRIADTRTFSQCLSRWWLSAVVSISIISVWIWLSAVAGFILKAACHFDGVVHWLTRHLDIKARPLQSLGLTTGALVACVYWATAALIHTF